MNETMQTILTRRITRKFQNKPIPEADLDQIIQAALHAPSGMGKQTWQFTVVKNRDKIQRLAAVIARVLGREGYDMYAPEVLIIPSNDKESRFGKRTMPALWKISFWLPIRWESALCGSTSCRTSVMMQKSAGS